MKLINNWLQDYNRYFWKKMGGVMVISLLFLSLTSCQEDEILKEEEQNRVYDFFDSYIESNEFLLNFGLEMVDNTVATGLRYKNKYATKVVVFPYAEYDNITLRSDLIDRIDKGIGVSMLPTIIVNYWGEASLNFCFGVLINGDYYLVRFEAFQFLIEGEFGNHTPFIPDINIKYKY